MHRCTSAGGPAADATKPGARSPTADRDRAAAASSASSCSTRRGRPTCPNFAAAGAWQRQLVWLVGGSGDRGHRVPALAPAAGVGARCRSTCSRSLLLGVTLVIGRGAGHRREQQELDLHRRPRRRPAGRVRQARRGPDAGPPPLRAGGRPRETLRELAARVPHRRGPGAPGAGAAGPGQRPGLRAGSCSPCCSGPASPPSLLFLLASPVVSLLLAFTICGPGSPGWSLLIILLLVWRPYVWEGVGDRGGQLSSWASSPSRSGAAGALSAEPAAHVPQPGGRSRRRPATTPSSPRSPSVPGGGSAMGSSRGPRSGWPSCRSSTPTSSSRWWGRNWASSGSWRRWSCSSPCSWCCSGSPGGPPIPSPACVVFGILGLLFTHVFENVGMTVNVMPITGIPLPFFSYGGSFLLATVDGCRDSRFGPHGTRRLAGYVDM